MRSTLRLSLLLLLTVVATWCATTLTGVLPFEEKPPSDAGTAPYNNGANCHFCHDGPTGGGGETNMSVTGLPNRYEGGETYSVTVEASEGGVESAPIINWGFEATTTDDSDDFAGNFLNPDPFTGITNTTGRQFAHQNALGSFSGDFGPVAWTFDWTAPPVEAGTVYFWASALIGDQDGTEFGDRTYAYSLAIPPVTETSLSARVTGQPYFPVSGVPTITRGSGRMRAEFRVRNVDQDPSNYIIITRVRLPNGTMFPTNGFLQCIHGPRLDPGESYSITFDRLVPNNAPFGNYELVGIVGRRDPWMPIDSYSIPFSVVD